MRAWGTDAIPLLRRPTIPQYQALGRELAAACRSGDPGALRDWAAALTERVARRRDVDEVGRIVQAARDSNLDSGDDPEPAAQQFVAAIHGFESWAQLADHLDSIDNPDSPVSRFEAAADAIVTGDIRTLEQSLTRNPDLVKARSTRAHHATLLHYAAANGHETFRQRTPANAPQIARRLLEAGADPDALADMYRHRCTTMEMLVSSVHPHAAGVQVALVETLLDFGGAIDGVEQNGSPLMTALSFHYLMAAEALARRGARVDNVIAAAALGRADLVESFVTDQGSLRPGVPLASVPWPSLPDDPRVHLEYALTWACMFGRNDVVRLMLRKGVSASARDGDATAMHFAAAYGRMDLVRLLHQHGASLEALNSYGGTVLDGTLWFAFNGPRGGVDYAAVVRELIELGARTDVYPEMRSHVESVLKGPSLMR